MIPSDLYPRFTETSSPAVEITVPLTISPVCKVTKDSLSICSNVSSSPSIVFLTSSISLIVVITSFIIAGGVDAPAVIPILSLNL